MIIINETFLVVDDEVVLLRLVKENLLTRGYNMLKVYYRYTVLSR